MFKDAVFLKSPVSVLEAGVTLFAPIKSTLKDEDKSFHWETANLTDLLVPVFPAPFYSDLTQD